MMRVLLIVDDQDGVLQTLDFVFKERGYRTVLAKSGPAAVALASAERLDAGLIDLHMPGMDGLAVCASLRAAGISIPIWIMTAACSRDAEKMARESGAVSVLRKPFAVDEFVRALETLLALPSATPASSVDGATHAG